ncbi:hypothetical protein KI387_011028, partial [Taxus chinensis]
IEWHFILVIFKALGFKEFFHLFVKRLFSNAFIYSQFSSHTDDAPPRTDDAPPRTDNAPPHENPPEIVGKALQCFGHVYTCPPEHRLTPSGTLNVPYEETDEYCNGGCFDETQVVLTCLDQILSNFEFYNKATIDDIRDTIVQACSHSDKR